ncbi:MAG: HEAT repeat domain-containing protein [Methylococcaceae bacterium]
MRSIQILGLFPITCLLALLVCVPVSAELEENTGEETQESEASVRLKYERWLAELKDEDLKIKGAALEKIFQGLMNQNHLPISVETSVVSALIEALSDFDSQNAVDMVVDSLKHVCNTNLLTEALATDDFRIRARSAYALSCEKSNHTLNKLVELLTDENALVRAAAAYAIGSIARDKHNEFSFEVAFKALKGLLKDKDLEVRRGVTRALGSIRDTRAVPSLIEALRDQDEGVRSEAIGGLAKIEDKSLLPVFIEFAKDPQQNTNARATAVEALAKFGDDSVIPVLLAAARDEHSDIRMEAVRGMERHIDNATVFSTLLTTLRDKDRDVRLSTALVLFKTKNKKAVPALVDTLKDVDPSIRTVVAQTLAELGDKRAIPSLLDSLEDEDHLSVTVTKYALNELLDKSDIPLLLAILKDSRSRSREYAAEKLGDYWHVANESLTPKLLIALKDKTWSVRANAVSSLARREKDNEFLLQKLIGAYDDDNENVRENVISALGERCDKRNAEVISVLETALLEPNQSLRKVAIEALGKCRSKTVVTALRNCLKDKESIVRRSAAEALGKLGDSSVSPDLIKIIKDEDVMVRKESIKALGAIGGATVVPELTELLGDKDPEVRSMVVQALESIGDQSAVPALIAALKDEYTQVKIKCIQALGTLKDKRAIAALTSQINSKNSKIRASVIEALGKIGNQSRIDVFEKAFQDEDQEVRLEAKSALIKLRAIPSLIGLLSAHDAETRVSAVEALGKIKDKTTLPELIDALHDESKDVRRASARALRDVANESVAPEIIRVFFNDQDKEVQQSAAWALENVLNKSFVPQIMGGLSKDIDGKTRSSILNILAAIGDKSAVPVFIKNLQHENSEIRAIAARALRSIGNNKAVPALLDALNDKTQSVRIYSAEALLNIKDNVPLDRLFEYFVKEEESRNSTESDWTPATVSTRILNGELLSKEANATIRKRAAEVLKNHEVWEIRKTMLSFLATAKEKKSVDAVFYALSDKNPEVRRAAVRILGEIKDRRVHEKLLERLADDDWNVRAQALESIGKIGGESAVSAVLKIIETNEWGKWVESQQMKGISNHAQWVSTLFSGNSDWLSLTQLLDNPNSGVRRYAVALLGWTENKTAVPLLINTLTDQDALIRQLSIVSLALIGDKRAHSALTENIRNEDKEHRGLSLMALATIASSSFRDFMKRGLKGDRLGLEDMDELFRISRDVDIDIDIVPDLIFALDDRNEEIATVAAFLLGLLREPSAIPILREKMGDDSKSSMEKGAAAFALARIGDQSALPAILKLFNKREIKVKAAVLNEIMRNAEDKGAVLDNYAQTGDIKVFNLIRKNHLLDGNIEKHLSSQDPSIRSSLTYLRALQSRENGNYPEQLSYASQSLSETDNKIDTGLAMLSLWIKAEAEIKLKKPKDARETIQEAVRMLAYISRFERALFREFFEAKTFFIKGNVYLENNDKKAAIATYQDALVALNTTVRRDRNSYDLFGGSWGGDTQTADKLEAMIRTNLGIAQLGLGKDNLQKAIKIGQRYQPLDSVEMENEEKRYLELAKQEIANGDYEKAQQLVEIIRLRKQTYFNKNLDISFSDPKMQRKSDEYRNKQRFVEILDRKISQLSEEDFKNRKELIEQRSKARRELKIYIQKLKKEQPDLAMLLGADPIELVAVQEILPKDTALLQYLVLSKKTIVFTIKNNGMELIEVPVESERLTHLVDSFRQKNASERARRVRGLENISDSQNSEGSTNSPDFKKELYDLLIKPIADKGYLDGINKLGISPNTFLHYLPFEALQDAKNQYVNDKYGIFYINVPSLLWVAMDRARKSDYAQAKLVAISNPDKSLMYADQEVTQIAKLFNNSSIYQHEKAKKAVITSEKLDNAILHFATHGEFRTDDSSKSYLLMSDGPLSVQEIWGLPLRGSIMSVLSACETGMGEIMSGDDLVSLETAFIYAGSPSVISTLWRVDDEATSILIEIFYENLIQGMATVEALADAKRKLRKIKEDYQHPYYWAAFTLHGSWN